MDSTSYETLKLYPSYLSSSHISKLWHARFGHSILIAYGEHSRMGVANRFAKGWESKASMYLMHQREKQLRDLRRVIQQLELPHMDLCGPMQQVSLGGQAYFDLIINDFSRMTWFNRMTWVHFLKHKSNVFVTAYDWMTIVELESC